MEIATIQFQKVINSRNKSWAQCRQTCFEIAYEIQGPAILQSKFYSNSEKMYNRLAFIYIAYLESIKFNTSVLLAVTLL